MHVADFLARLEKVRRNGEAGWMGCCPAHADRNPSLSVSEGSGGRILLKCFAGCSTEAVVGALGLELKDLMGQEEPLVAAGGLAAKTRVKGEGQAAEPPGGVNTAAGTGYGKAGKKAVFLGGLKPGDIWKLHKGDWEFVEWYDYHDAGGGIVYRKLRFRQVEPPYKKTFIQAVPDPESGAGMWRFGRSSLGVEEVLYNLPGVMAAAAAGGEVWIVEGEKDVRTAEALGLVATCNVDGAGKWRAGLGAVLKGCGRVWIIADKDPDEAEAKRLNPKAKVWLQGQRHACDIAADLAALGIGHKAVCLPDQPEWPVNDLTEWVEGAMAGRGGMEALQDKVLRDRLAAELRGVVQAAEPLIAARGLTAKTRVKGEEEAAQPPGGVPTAATKAGPGRAGAGQPPHGGVPSPAGGAGHKKNVGGGAGDEAGESVAWLRGELIRVMIDKDTSSLQKKRAMAGVVCGWLGMRGQYFYDVSDRGHGTAMWFDAIEKRLHRVGQDYFRSWLSRATGFSREFRDYKMFVSAVEDEALVGDGTRGITPRRYWHREGDVIYISNGEGRMARIDREDARLVDNGTDGVVFEQRYVLDEWELVPESEALDPFSACTVFSGISTVDGRGPMLVRLWFSGMFGSVGWKPLLVLSGTVGSGKTRVATAFFELLGMPARVTAIDALGNIKDFWASVDKGGLFCLDNADHHVGWLPDALSVISTGGTFEKKKLYTDMETVTQEARCWTVVTSANPSFASDAGLSDRLITVLLQRVERETAESVLSEEIKQARDPGLSWLCYTMQRALGWQEPVPKKMNRRHPDWAAWAWKIGAAAGYAHQAETALRENEAYKALFSVQNDVFGRYLLAGITEPWKGGGADLASHLEEACEGFSSETWTVTKIGKALGRLGVALKEIFNFEKLNHGGRAVYVFDAPQAILDSGEAAEPSPTLPMLGYVGDVGVNPIKSPNNNEMRELLHNNPHIPNIPQHNIESEEM